MPNSASGDTFVTAEPSPVDENRQAMVAAQEKYPARGVEGIILFAYNELDPKTEPWTRLVHSFYLDELLLELERRQPEHPLVAVFKPVFIEDDAIEMILLGELPDLEDTVAGKELIAIGEERAKVRSNGWKRA